mmetsp:Transcript_8639/g.20087  ORF Transcript_8639/g.20087 Transcript_8639/m.20087 type:complete len:248 (+) Transcript_8639:1037-1780(+)
MPGDQLSNCPFAAAWITSFSPAEISPMPMTGAPASLNTRVTSPHASRALAAPSSSAHVCGSTSGTSAPEASDLSCSETRTSDPPSGASGGVVRTTISGSGTIASGEAWTGAEPISISAFFCASEGACCCCCCCCAPNFSARYWGEPRRRRALKSVGSRSGLWKPSSTVDPCAPRIISVTARPSTDTPSTVRRMSPMRTSPERSADCPGAIRRTACSPSGLCRSTSPTPACSSCKGGGGGMSFSNPPC